MPKIEELSRLFNALAKEDTASAADFARRIISAEEKIGHHAAARRLAGALSRNGGHGFDRDPRHATNGSANFLSGALLRRNPSKRLRDVSLPTTTREELVQVAQEHRGAARLRAAGIRRRSKLLFSGPPGCGKSLAAGALALELGLPVYLVRFDSLIGAFLGQTATHLRQLFHFAESTECVLLLDEIDALGQQRGRPTEMGELDRIVIALMQELEVSEVKGLVVATSNLAEALDRALWRRFDLHVHFPAPIKSERWRFAQETAKAYHVALGAGAERRFESLSSYAEIEKAVEDVARRKAMQPSR